ncbi:MAG: hypothetical protein DLM69_01820 [Candidatus Chloroheliales bacterium]|nr:MAG: hypothetical protein DLM69_01820 [Chloroflexota bacterium]
MTQRSKFKYIYLPAAAEMLGVQRSVLIELVKQGRLKVISNEGQTSVFRTADVEKLAEELGLANPATAPEVLSANPEAGETPRRTRRPRDAVQKVSLRVASLKKWLDVSDEEAREWALAQEPIAHPAIRRQLGAVIDKLTNLQQLLKGE